MAGQTMMNAPPPALPLGVASVPSGIASTLGLGFGPSDALLLTCGGDDVDGDSDDENGARRDDGGGAPPPAFWATVAEALPDRRVVGGSVAGTAGDAPEGKGEPGRRPGRDERQGREPPPTPPRLVLHPSVEEFLVVSWELLMSRRQDDAREEGGDGTNYVRTTNCRTDQRHAVPSSSGRIAVPVTVRCTVPSQLEDGVDGVDDPSAGRNTFEVRSATYRARRVAVRELGWSGDHDDYDDDDHDDGGGCGSGRTIDHLTLRLVHSDEESFESAILSRGAPPSSAESAPMGDSSCYYLHPHRRAMRTVQRGLAGGLIAAGAVVPISLPPSWSDDCRWDASLAAAASGVGGSGVAEESVAYLLVESVKFSAGPADGVPPSDSDEEGGGGDYGGNGPAASDDDSDGGGRWRCCYRLGPAGSFRFAVLPFPRHDGHAKESFRDDDEGDGTDLPALATSPASSAQPSELSSTDSVGADCCCPGYGSLVDELLHLANVGEPRGAPAAVLLTGCAGVGKTRLASCVARKLIASASSDPFPSSDVVRHVSARDVLLASAYLSLQDLRSCVLPPRCWVGSEAPPPLAPDAVSGSSRIVLLIDDLDAIVNADGGEEEGAASFRDPERILAQNAVVAAIDELVQLGNEASAADREHRSSNGGNSRPFILGLCRADASQLPTSLIRVGRFEKVVTMSAPTEHQREEILRSVLDQLPIAPSSSAPSEGETVRRWAAALASRTAGCVASDLRRICSDALTRANSRASFEGGVSSHGSALKTFGANASAALVEWEDIKEATRACVPSQLARLDVSTSTVIAPDDDTVVDGRIDYKRLHERSWEQFGGYDEMKDRLYRTVVGPWKRQTSRIAARAVSSFEMEESDTKALAASLDIPPPSGILFHGPPGVGKTMAAHCLASSLGLPVVKVRASDVLDQWLGGSEAAIRSLFERARAAAPCILFFDEIDSLATNREDDDGSTDVHSRVLSTLLNEMDGVSSRSGREGLLVVAATNRLGAIDAALLRPGRLEEHVEIPKPTARDIEEMLKIRTAKIRLGCDVSCEDLAMRLENLGATGADIEGICTGACLCAIRRCSHDADLSEISLTGTECDEAIRQWKL